MVIATLRRETDMVIPPLDALIKNRPNKLLALDPGDTTGVSIWIKGSLRTATTMRRDLLLFKRVIEHFAPDIIAMESYRIYAHKTNQHTHSDVPTLRLIGAIELIAEMQRPAIPIVFQSASQAKGFVTDQKLEAWGLYDGINKHARDSIRHAVYYMIMGGEGEGGNHG
jgi:hypothetical protein